MIRLSGADRKALAAKIKADIEAACAKHYAGEPRDHLGASEIGEKCTRKLVYSFRWMHRETFSGQMLRLFDTGHRTEPRIIEWLQLIGAKALPYDPVTGKQFRIPSNGHWGGSADGKVTLPYDNLPEFLLEMKTHNLKSFTNLKEHGVKQSKPKHYEQMCVYGLALNYDYGLYFANCKNDDNIYIEILELDKSLGRMLEKKAQAVITAPQLPPKIAASDAFFDCKYCSMAGICHRGELPDYNCRSCKNSVPVENGAWRCQLWNAIIPHDAIPNGCREWVAFT
jgi:hypothetical protein